MTIMHLRSFSFALPVFMWSSFTLTTSAWILPNQANNRRTFPILNAESHFLPADVISRTGAPVSGITYSNYDSNPTAATRSASPNSNNNQTPTEPFTARGQLIDPSASLKREDTIISSPPSVPTTPRVVPTTIVTRGHPVDEVGVRRWRETIAPPMIYSVTSLPSAATIPEPAVAADSVRPVAEPIESHQVDTTPEKAAFQQAEKDRWTEAARRDEQKRLERQAEKESFQKDEMVRWTEAAKRDAHSKKSKKSGKAKSSRKKNNSSSKSGKQ